MYRLPALPGLLAAALALALVRPAPAQDPVPEPDPADVATVDAIVEALYDVISGGVDEPRDWDRFRSLFRPDGRLLPTGRDGEGRFRMGRLGVEEYIETSGPGIEAIGFVEREIGRSTEAWGNISHVFSAYEAFRDGQPVPFLRGINSIQLWNDGARWWIVTVMWEPERPDNPLPAELICEPGDPQG